MYTLYIYLIKIIGIKGAHKKNFLFKEKYIILGDIKKLRVAV